MSVVARGRRTVRAGLRGVAASGATQRVIGVLERLGRTPDVVAVLMYHRVDAADAAPHLDPALLSATPDGFGEQLRFVRDHCRVLAMEELLDRRRTGRSLPPGSVLLTFDDAYRDFADQAWPLLRAYGLPATLFVPTALPGAGRAFWWDRLHAALAGSALTALDDDRLGHLPLTGPSQRAAALRALKREVKSLPHDRALRRVDDLVDRLGGADECDDVLGWDDLRRLATEGVTLAPHSRTHAMLDRLDPSAVRDEVAGSLADLRREAGGCAPVFAYPSGQYDDAVVDALAAAGYAAAFTADRGVEDLRRADWLRLRRIPVGRHTGLPLLRAQMVPSIARLEGRLARVLD